MRWRHLRTLPFVAVFAGAAVDEMKSRMLAKRVLIVCLPPKLSIDMLGEEKRENDQY
jgi:hypothetical protein